MQQNLRCHLKVKHRREGPLCTYQLILFLYVPLHAPLLVLISLLLVFNSQFDCSWKQKNKSSRNIMLSGVQSNKYVCRIATKQYIWAITRGILLRFLVIERLIIQCHIGRHNYYLHALVMGYGYKGTFLLVCPELCAEQLMGVRKKRPVEMHSLNKKNCYSMTKQVPRELMTVIGCQGTQFIYHAFGGFTMWYLLFSLPLPILL